MNKLIILVLTFIFSCVLSSAQPNPEDRYWSSEFAIPTTDEVRTMLLVDDYIYMNEFGKLVRWNINNQDYEILGISAAGSIYCIAKHYGAIYVGGNFERMSGTSAAFIAKWENGIWDTVASGINGKVNAICFDSSDNMWIGGQFTTVNGLESNYIARRNGNIWEPVEGFNSQVRTIVSRNGKVYAGGDFNFYDSARTDYSMVAVFDGQSWRNHGILGSNAGGKVISLAFREPGFLIAGGIFENDGTDNISPNVAYFDGSRWKSLGEGLDGMVLSLACINDDVYAGGYFNHSGEIQCRSIARFDGSIWTEVDGGASGGDYPSVLSLAASESGLFAGGNFTRIGSIDCWNTAYLFNGSWMNYLPETRNGTISSIGTFTVDKKNDILYAGGGFVRTGNRISYGISKFVGKDWLGCNSGLTPTSNVVYSMQAVGDTVYFSGWFNYADGIRLRNVAKWIDSKKTWEPVGNGIEGGDGDMGAILVSNDKIYVSGNFRYVMNGSDTVFTNYITYWDGTKWNPMGSGLARKNNQRVFVEKMIESLEGHIIAVGTFDFSGAGISSNYAEWDPDSLEWKYGMSGGKYFSNSVNTVLYDEQYYYFGGAFDSAGVLYDVNGLVRLNRNTGEWQKCANGVDGTVNALVKWDEDIYIAGRFRTASGNTCNSVARYNPQEDNISPLGSGITYGTNVGTNTGLASVYDMIVYKNELYFGGMFTSAGGKKSSSNIAKWTKAPVNVSQQRIESDICISPNPASDYIEISVGSVILNEVKDLRIFDLLGKEITTPSLRATPPYQGGEKVRIDVSHLAPGVYFVRVGDVVRKFVKL
jgi:hypothetical protein